MLWKSLLGGSAAAALLLGTAGVASADPPANDVLVDVTCPSLGTTQARLPNIRASLESGKTLVTGISTEFGPGIVFDVFDIYDTGRGNAPVVEGRGIAENIEVCTVDLTPIVGFPYVIPTGLKLTGQAAK
jgi:hypothetical protein